MSESILVINAGSSSIKFSVIAHAAAGLQKRLGGQIDGIGSSPRFRAVTETGGKFEKQWQGEKQLGHEALLEELLAWLGAQPTGGQVAAVGHRVVHGGTMFHAPVIVSVPVLDALEELVPLAPLHQPHNLAPIRTILKRHPELPQVACFDTSFHRTNPRIAQMFALPRRFDEQGITRYGFHGLSYEYIASALTDYLGKERAGRVIVAHLGNGASLCALLDGRSVASSMGFTALEGIPMGTRTGSIDPGVLLYFLQQLKLSPADVEQILYRESGLLGVSGISSDMRVLEQSEEGSAQEAIDLFIYRIVREIGSLTMALGGLDAIVFTAGIGENSARIRAGVCQAIRWLGFELDAFANDSHGPRITKSSSPCSAWVIPTNEEIQIARHTVKLLQLPSDR